MTREK